MTKAGTKQTVGRQYGAGGSGWQRLNGEWVKVSYVPTHETRAQRSERRRLAWHEQEPERLAALKVAADQQRKSTEEERMAAFQRRMAQVTG